MFKHIMAFNAYNHFPKEFPPKKYMHSFQHNAMLFRMMCIIEDQFFVCLFVC